jgi:hypothetical protein
MMSELHPGFPDGYPNTSYPHPLALTIGSVSSPTCQGEASNVSSVIRNLTVSYESPPGEEELPDTPHGHEMDFISTVMRSTEVYLDAIQEASARSVNLSRQYPATGNSLANQLKIVARLIAGGLQTQIYIVSLGGFDTHSNQVDEGNPQSGKHARLLEDLSQALFAFQDDITLHGIQDDVMGFVFSEFGRRIKSNASRGTDHGAAWPAILFGSKVYPGVLGDNPVIPGKAGKQDNLPMQFDFRSIYGSILSAWLEADTDVIKTVLFKDFDALQLLRPPDFKVWKDTEPEQGIAKIYPNPMQEKATVAFYSAGGELTLSIYSTDGKLRRILLDRYMDEGKHQLEFHRLGLPSGAYYLTLQSRYHRKTAMFSIH